MFDPVNLTQSIDNFSDFGLRYAVALAAVGSLTMAILEAIKKVWRLRERYHQAALRRWICGVAGPDLVAHSPEALKGMKLQATQAKAPFDDNRDNYDYHDWVYYELVHLTTGTSPDRVPSMQLHARRRHHRTLDMALFSLPLEKMMGQIQDAADTAVAHPSVYPYLYSFLVAGVETADADLWLEHAASGAPAISADPSLQKEETRKLTDVYSRLTKFVRHKLDAFQLVTGYSWREANQFWAVCIGFVVMLATLLMMERGELGGALSGHDWAAVAADLFVIGSTSLIGGILAPIAKDIVAALSKVRSGN